MVFPSSAIQVLQATADKLVILDPPNYLPGNLYLAAAAVFFLFTAARHLKGIQEFAGYLVAVVCLVIGLGYYSEQQIIFSKDDPFVRFDRGYFRIYHEWHRVRLAEIDAARVTTNEDTHNLELLFHNSEFYQLIGYSRREGYASAAQAINEFLRMFPHL